ncbi:MAG: BamA/TamA family outer membrane protein [Melioribacteraceae bacterium]|nr:BamA/TamA family outer membrane protein [Melioribacteraceae bacterium]
MIPQTIKLFFFLFLISLQAQTIQKIDVIGAKEFSSSEYINWSKVSIGSSFQEELVDTIKYNIKRNLNDLGYFNSELTISVDSLLQDSVYVINLNYNINEGSPSYIKNISISGINKIDSANIYQQFSFLEGEIYSSNRLEEVISNSLDYLEDNGFPFAVIKINSVVFENDTLNDESNVNINLMFEKGLLGKIDNIEILGNTKTKDYVITRELRIDSSEVYSQNRIDEIPPKLNRLRFFQPVKRPLFYLNNKDEGILQISVEEKETNNFDGVVGYVPGNDNEKGYFTGFVNISLRNLFGTGRGAAFRWEQLSRETQEIEIKYLEPWLLSYPFNINLGLFQRKQDTTYVQRHINVQLDYLATEEISAGFIFETQATIPTDNGTNQFTVFNSSTITTGVNFQIDSRDDFYAPTSGVYFLNSYKYSRKKINGPARFITSQTETNITLQKIEVDFNTFIEIFNRNIIAIGVHGRELQGSFFEISDLYFLGGTNSLRGYRERQFQGNRLLWSNLEYRYLLTRRSFAFAFFDSGYFLRSEDQSRNIQKISDVKLGYGIGINLETGLGVLGVSFALAQGESFSEGKIHFGLLNEF